MQLLIAQFRVGGGQAFLVFAGNAGGALGIAGGNCIK
jgi:hypothetical protein